MSNDLARLCARAAALRVKSADGWWPWSDTRPKAELLPGSAAGARHFRRDAVQPERSFEDAPSSGADADAMRQETATIEARLAQQKQRDDAQLQKFQMGPGAGAPAAPDVVDPAAPAEEYEGGTGDEWTPKAPIVPPTVSPADPGLSRYIAPGAGAALGAGAGALLGGKKHRGLGALLGGGVGLGGGALAQYLMENPHALSGLMGPKNSADTHHHLRMESRLVPNDFSSLYSRALALRTKRAVVDPMHPPGFDAPDHGRYGYTTYAPEGTHVGGSWSPTADYWDPSSPDAEQQLITNKNLQAMPAAWHKSIETLHPHSWAAPGVGAALGAGAGALLGGQKRRGLGALVGGGLGLGAGALVHHLVQNPHIMANMFAPKTANEDPHFRSDYMQQQQNWRQNTKTLDNLNSMQEGYLDHAADLYDRPYIAPGIGTALGAGAGALLGGEKHRGLGAMIGGGVGLGGGALVQHLANHPEILANMAASKGLFQKKGAGPTYYPWVNPFKEAGNTANINAMPKGYYSAYSTLQGKPYIAPSVGAALGAGAGALWTGKKHRDLGVAVGGGLGLGGGLLTQHLAEHPEILANLVAKIKGTKVVSGSVKDLYRDTTQDLQDIYGDTTQSLRAHNYIAPSVGAALGAGAGALWTGKKHRDLGIAVGGGLGLGGGFLAQHLAEHPEILTDLVKKIKGTSIKTGADDEGPYAGMRALSMQQYAPIQKRRDLTNEEEDRIAQGQSRIFPKIFQSGATPVHEMMASPGWAAAGHGVMGGALGGGLGLALTHGNHPAVKDAPWLPAALGVGGAGIGALLGYHSRRAENQDLEEAMRRLPEGAVQRDYMADPTVQAAMDRRNQLAAARLSAGSRFMY